MRFPANSAAHVFFNLDVECGIMRPTGYKQLNSDQLARNDIYIALVGREASASVNGLAMTSGTQYHDTHLVIDHVIGETNSEMTFRNMVDGKGEATFNGRVLICKDSQRSATEQSIANLSYQTLLA